MEKIAAKIDVEGVSTGLTLTVRLNSEIVAVHQSPEPTAIEFEFNEQDGKAQLELELSGKTADHTVIDNDGNIVSDNTVTVNNVAFDGIELGHLLYEKTEYYHDFNGTSEKTVDRFYGTMGCNGTVVLKFTCPFYVWLLENM